MRLFVALDLPASIIEALCMIELPPAHRLSPVRPDQMHITLHFIGAADIDEVRNALASVCCKPCRVSVRGVGSFRIPARGSILWAGVDAIEELLALHQACASALGAIGIRIERRRYTPHVTIARLRSPADELSVNAFLQSGQERDFGSFVARQFVLYDSVTLHDGARYERIESYALS
ncbi:MAG TPA: RNA 2',3'-cyclic phosphodiesterase [Gammaproteobacteria bacterium]|nr:RNA 2',3'-cyclic phosphodiesterase [Gammaproteobacteria bacterium]